MLCHLFIFWVDSYCFYSGVWSAGVGLQVWFKLLLYSSVNDEINHKIYFMQVHVHLSGSSGHCWFRPWPCLDKMEHIFNFLNFDW